ncbi:hypothetical protein [Neorhizobium sp. T6_25]|uniref:hypothetical protein n=1 Tax=Neorhizobium sp. T6_25 TaxID=2093833 RepID=UPI00155F32DC|nr:hypothetical protein [Neorhizobium sp. T6_25]
MLWPSEPAWKLPKVEAIVDGCLQTLIEECPRSFAATLNADARRRVTRIASTFIA